MKSGHLIILGLVALAVAGGCSTPTPDEVCAEYGKEAVPLGESEDGIPMYNCVPPGAAQG